MIYQEHSPSDHLKEVVDGYWSFQIPDREGVDFPVQHETLPDSSVSVVLIRQPYFQGVRLLGPHTQKFEQTIFPDSTYLGIRLWPWLRFEPALFDKSAILNATASAPGLLSNKLEGLVHGPFEINGETLSHLEKQLTTLFSMVEVLQDDLVKFICLELAEGQPVKAIQDQLPHSTRVIQRRFKAITGLTMKQYAGNIRQRRLWIDLLKKEKSKTELIYEHNFFDQAHFINDFKKKMQRSHTDFEAYLHSIDISLD